MLSSIIYVNVSIVQVQSGATFVRLDKIANPRDGNPALLIQGIKVF